MIASFTTRTDRDMLDSVIVWIVILAGIAGIAFLGVENVPQGIAVAIDTIHTFWRGYVQIFNAVLFHDVVPGPIAEDDTIHVVIFTVRDWLGLGNK